MKRCTWLALGLAAAACKGESNAPAPEPTPAQARDARAADAAAPPPEVPTVDQAVGAPLPRQPGEVLVIDAIGRIGVADAPPPWDGAVPERTRPLPEPELEQRWLEEQRGGTATRLALDAGKLTPAKGGAARKRRPRPRVVPADSPRSRILRAAVPTDPGDDQGRFTPAIFASPTAPARLLAKVLVLQGGTVVVRTDATPRALSGALKMYTGPGEPPGEPWIELHLDDRGVHVLLIPNKRSSPPKPFASKLVAWGELDQASLGAALAEHAGSTASPPEVDLVVGDGASVQRFVDVIAHMHALGIRTFGVAERGAPPDSRHLQEPDRAWIKRTIGQYNTDFAYCYERRLQEKPSLAGTVTSTFLVSPDGHTSLVQAVGMDAAVADCVALVIEGIRFPPFDQPDGIPVRYPFIFREVGSN